MPCSSALIYYMNSAHISLGMELNIEVLLKYILFIKELSNVIFF